VDNEFTSVISPAIVGRGTLNGSSKVMEDFVK